jgi:hypothetical protein
MIHLEVCSLLFGQKTKLHTALRRRLGVGVRVSLQDLHPLDPIRKKLEDINLSNNATNYSTTAQLPTKKCKSFATPNSWVPFQIRSFKISQHSTISTFARLPSRSTSQDIILNEIASDESIQLCQILVWKTSTSTLAIIPFWMKFNFFEQKQMQSPPWLSRWRVRRVLIHMRRAKKRNWNWLRVTKNVTKLRRDESTIQSWDPEFKPYW